MLLYRKMSLTFWPEVPRNLRGKAVLTPALASPSVLLQGGPRAHLALSSGVPQATLEKRPVRVDPLFLGPLRPRPGLRLGCGCAGYLTPSMAAW